MNFVLDDDECEDFDVPEGRYVVWETDLPWRWRVDDIDVDPWRRAVRISERRGVAVVKVKEDGKPTTVTFTNKSRGWRR